ncbi:FkbM family methyltransferase [Ilumatobacter sp.]|uniref:FkbM family methyltransferase n=1 Tax=Ilumatobacter sp. TaxID=1967498 RepID=UPI003B526D39
MSYRVALPAGGTRSELDVVDPFSTMIQRQLRRGGLASYEPATAAALLALFEMADDGFAFLDIGANVGLYAALCAAMSSPGAVHAFEPAPSTAAVARSLIAANGLDVTVHEVALSDATGSAVLHLSATSDASNSLVAGFKREVGAVEVSTARLDDVVGDLGVSPAVIKIDVESHEPEVLSGARGVLRDHRPVVVIEVLRRRGRDHGLDVTRAFEGLGYRFVELSATPTWEVRDRLVGSGTEARDWLALPSGLDPSFPERWARWRDRLAECGPERNSRVPIVASLRRSWSDRGVAGVARSIERHLRVTVLPAATSHAASATGALARRLRRR